MLKVPFKSSKCSKHLQFPKTRLSDLFLEASCVANLAGRTESFGGRHVMQLYCRPVLLKLFNIAYRQCTFCHATYQSCIANPTLTTIPAENDTKRAGKQVVTFFFYFGDHLHRRRARGIELNFSVALLIKKL